MGLNTTAFMKDKLEHRTEEISVPALADWFDGDPVWIVRGLGGSEVSSAQETVAKNKNIGALAQALVSPDQTEKVRALRDLIGTSDNVPDELAKRIDMLVSGSVEPKVDFSLAVKLADNFPVEFMNLTTKIIVLTGLGSTKVKLKPSGGMTQP